MSDTETCPTMVSKGDIWHPRDEPCGRPIKRDGMCGIHARAEAEANRKAAERQDAAAARTDLAKRLGIPFIGEPNSWGASLVPYADLKALADRIAPR